MRIEKKFSTVSDRVDLQRPCRQERVHPEPAVSPGPDGEAEHGLEGDTQQLHQAEPPPGPKIGLLVQIWTFLENGPNFGLFWKMVRKCTEFGLFLENILKILQILNLGANIV